MRRKSIKKHILAIRGIAAKKKRKANHGRRISETKRINKELNKKFPIGTMVYQKYYPKYVGIIASTVASERSYFDADKLYSRIHVLWMHNKWYGDGVTVEVPVTDLMIRKEKKVL